MKSNVALLAWAERWHYPYLRLDEKDAVRYGRKSWEAFVSSRDRKRKQLAWARIQRWNARVFVGCEHRAGCFQPKKGNPTHD